MANPMPSARQRLVADSGIILPAWFMWLSQLPTSPVLSFNARTGEVTLQASDISALVGAWQDVATGVGFQNAWVNFGAPYGSASYRTEPDGTVRLRGLIKNGTLGTTAFTLPAGFRPTGSRLFPASSNVAAGTVQVDATGAVTPNGGSNVYITLDGITFSTS